MLLNNWIFNKIWLSIRPACFEGYVLLPKTAFRFACVFAFGDAPPSANGDARQVFHRSAKAAYLSDKLPSKREDFW